MSNMKQCDLPNIPDEVFFLKMCNLNLIKPLCIMSSEKKKRQGLKKQGSKLYHEKNNRPNSEYRIFYKSTGLDSSKSKCHEI